MAARTGNGKKTAAKKTPRAPRGEATASPTVLYEVSDRIERHARLKPYEREPGAPLNRPLRIYSLDPSLSDRLGGVATVLVPYEKLEPGPKGSLFEVDCSGAPSLLACEPLNLDDPYLLLSAGLSPSPANGRFHAQMTYAVCSLTYSVFRRALGRDIAWSVPERPGEPLRLKVRPFGFRGANAAFNRDTGDLSFGYFEVKGERAGFTLKDGIVCTALSHDVVAHETTHALLDGLRASFFAPTNVDVPAFHEGFSDLVALFLHFTYPDMVERAIRDSRGSLARGSILTDVAREFGYARSRSDRATPLRSGVDVDGIAAFDSDELPGNGKPKLYDPKLDPHLLGSVLVSAVFEAFATIVRRKTERYFQIAGVDPATVGTAPLSDALTKAVAQEASDVAGRFLDICIRAIDYCPPTDMELGEYLRALITADADLAPTDKYGFREALMRSFRRRDIFPDHIKFMTEDAVRWTSPNAPLSIPGLAFRMLRFDGEPGRPASVAELKRRAHVLGTFVTDAKHASHFHLVSPNRRPAGIVQASPPQIESVRVARRVCPDGRVVFDLVAEVTQSCTAEHKGVFFDMNGGCTVLIDPDGAIRYVIYKKFTSEDRRARQHAAIRGPLARLWQRSGKTYTPRPNVLHRVHGMA